MHKKFKTLFFLLTLLGTQQLYAAPTDCIQLASDGQVNCTKAKSVFKYAVSNAPETDTFEETVAWTTQNWCNSSSQQQAIDCYAQWEGSPMYPPAGYSICGNGSKALCGRNTSIDYNTSNNHAGWVIFVSMKAQLHLSPDQREHSMHSGVVYHWRICPKNTTAVNVGNDTYLRFCKPKSEIKENPTSCSSSCNINTGSASISN